MKVQCKLLLMKTTHLGIQILTEGHCSDVVCGMNSLSQEWNHPIDVMFACGISASEHRPGQGVGAVASAGRGAGWRRRRIEARGRG